MKTKSGFQIVKVADENFVVPVGENAASFNGVVSLSEPAAYLLEKMNIHHTKDELKELLVNEYDVEPSVAENDLDRFIRELNAMGLLEE